MSILARKRTTGRFAPLCGLEAATLLEPVPHGTVEDQPDLTIWQVGHPSRPADLEHPSEPVR
jgi:hypothetical protein